MKKFKNINCHNNLHAKQHQVYDKTQKELTTCWLEKWSTNLLALIIY